MQAFRFVTAAKDGFLFTGNNTLNEREEAGRRIRDLLKLVDPNLEQRSIKTKHASAEELQLPLRIHHGHVGVLPRLAWLEWLKEHNEQYLGIVLLNFERESWDKMFESVLRQNSGTGCRFLSLLCC